MSFVDPHDERDGSPDKPKDLVGGGQSGGSHGTKWYFGGRRRLEKMGSELRVAD